MSESNPYAVASSPDLPQAPTKFSRAPLLPAAIGILVLSILQLIGGVFYAAFVYMELSHPGITPEDYRQLIYFLSIYGATAIYAVILIFGAIGMMRRGSYMWAVTTCILALAPLIGPCYVLAIPFGIWGLIVLKRPSVRDTFNKI